MKRILCLFTLLGLFAHGYLSAQPLSGVKTIKAGGDYPDFGAAVSALNANGVGTGGVTFKVPAGATLSGANFIISASGTGSDPIIFVKDGAGSNPVIKGQGASGSISDFFIKIAGGDYITFDGIDLQSDPTATDDLLKVEYGFYITNYNAFDGAHSITIKNCTVTLERTATNKQAAVFSKYDISPADFFGGNSDLTFENISVKKGKDGIVIYGNYGYPAELIKIKNCKIGSPDEGLMTSFITSFGYGIGIYYGKDVEISENEIQNVVTADTYHAIYANYTAGYNRIYNNIIHNLFSTKTDPEIDVMGIFYSGTNSSVGNIFNNLVYDLNDSQAVEGNPLYYHITGIMNEGMGQANFLHNTICLRVQNPKTLSVGLWIYGTASTARNNIIADYSVPSVSTGGRVLVLLSNTPKFEYNLLYIDESITGNYAFNSTTFTKFSDLQKGSVKPSPGYYINNIFADPNFTGPENFIPQNPSLASGNAQPDETVEGSLNGISRSNTHPDIGAYEGDFGVTEHKYPPAIMFTPIPNNADDEIKLQAIVYDDYGVTSAKLWYRKAGSSLDFTAVNGTQYGYYCEFKFSPAAQGDYEYFISAVDASENVISNGFMKNGLDASKTGLAVNNPAPNPDYVYKFGYKKSTLSGDVTVGMESSDYPSLTGAGGLFEAINSSVISGNINAIITGDILETGAVDLKQWAESGTGGYRLTIKPHNATLHTLVTITAGKGIIFTGSDRITIDGSFSNDNLSHLKIDNSGFNPLRFFSDAANGSENVIIKYCILNTAAGASGLFISGSNHKDFLIDHLTINKSGAGILLNYVTNAVVSNCSIGSSDPGNSVSYYGIRSTNSSNIVIEKNSITNISYATSSPYGIYLSAIRGGRCEKNIIKGIQYTGTDAYGALGIFLLSSSSMTISNNVISGVQGKGSSSLSYNNCGFYIGGCSALIIFYNSVNLYGIETNTNPNAISTALMFEYNSDCEIINNIFSNHIENSVSSTKSYALMFNTAYDKSNVFRNNIYHIDGSGSNEKYLIKGYSIVTSDLKEWQSVEFKLSDGVDLGSGSADPGFISYASDNLALSSSSPAPGSGIPVSVTEDINGVARNTAKPTIGAYESGYPLTNDVCGPVIAMNPIQNSASTTFSWSAAISDNSSVSNAELRLRVKGSTGAFTVIAGIKQGDNITWTFNVTGLLPDAEYEYFVTAADIYGNSIMNGIAPFYHTGLNPVFVRYFKVTENSIAVGAMPETVYISNTHSSSVAIPFTITGTYTGNQFIAWLSNETGSFTGRREIGRITSNASGTITGTIPFGILTSGNYKIIIESTNPVVSSPEGHAFRIINDNVAPTVTLTSPSPNVTGSPIPLIITFSEKVTGFTAAGINVVNGTISGFTGADRYFTALVTPVTDGSVIIGIPAFAAADLSSNPSSSSMLLEFLYISKEAPKADVSASDLKNYFNTSSKSVIITFDQDITGFDISDIEVTNCTKSDFSPDGTYPSRIFRLNIHPLSEEEVIVYIPEGSVTNGIYPNGPAGKIFYYDITKPVIALSILGTPDEITGKFSVVAVIDSKTEGFDLTDLNIVNASAENFKSLSSGLYSFDLTPTGYGLVTVEAAAESVIDEAGNTNLVSNKISVNYIVSNTGENIIPGFRVYPNPTYGTFHIEVPEDRQLYTIDVIDIQGKTIITHKGSGLTTIDLAGYKKGVYMIRTTLNGYSRIVKLIYQ